MFPWLYFINGFRLLFIEYFPGINKFFDGGPGYLLLYSGVKLFWTTIAVVVFNQNGDDIKGLPT